MATHPLIEKFLIHLRVEKGLSLRTIDTYMCPLKALDQFAIGKSLDLKSITDDNILAFLTQRKDAELSSSTMFLTVLSLRLFYRFLTGRGLIQKNPTARLSLPEVEESIPDPLSFSELDRLLTQPIVDKFSIVRTHLLISLAYTTGLRASEITGLRLNQINLENGFIRVRGKRRRERMIPLGPRIQKELCHYLKVRNQKFPNNSSFLFLSCRGRSIDRKIFWWLLKRWAKRVGVPESVSPHKLRHSFATVLISNGTSMRALQLLLGHRHQRQTERYAHVNFGLLRESMKNHPRFM